MEIDTADVRIYRDCAEFESELQWTHFTLSVFKSCKTTSHLIILLLNFFSIQLLFFYGRLQLYHIII